MRKVGSEHDVDDMTLARAPIRRNRLGHGDWAFEREIVAQTELFDEFTVERLDEGLPSFHATTG